MSACVQYVCPPGSEARPKAADRPNIIIVNADDLGIGDVNVYQKYFQNHQLRFDYGINPRRKVPSDRTIVTPFIDQLAQEGILFTNGYSGSSLCGPSRTSLMTGLHLGKTSVRSNNVEGERSLLTEKVGIATALKKAGYRTGFFGKWGVDFSSESNPCNLGFEEYVGIVSSSAYYPLLLDAAVFDENTKSCRLKKMNIKDNYWGQFWAGRIFPEMSVRFMEKAYRESAPFFVYNPHNAPHAGTRARNAEGGAKRDTGFPAPTTFAKPFLSQPWTKTNPKELEYASAVYSLDYTVGQLVHYLKNTFTKDGRSLWDNTVVIFTADNGGEDKPAGIDHSVDFFGSRVSMSGSKRSLLEGGHRVPFISSGGLVKKRGAVSEFMASQYNLMATFKAAAGLSLSEEEKNKEFWASLTGAGESRTPDFIYHEFCNPDNRKGVWGQQVRMGDNVWICLYDVARDSPISMSKLCKEGEQGSMMMYNLETDFSQTRPKSWANMSEKEKELTREALAVMKREHVPKRYCLDVSNSTF